MMRKILVSQRSILSASYSSLRLRNNKPIPALLKFSLLPLSAPSQPDSPDLFTTILSILKDPRKNATEAIKTFEKPQKWQLRAAIARLGIIFSLTLYITIDSTDLPALFRLLETQFPAALASLRGHDFLLSIKNKLSALPPREQIAVISALAGARDSNDITSIAELTKLAPTDLEPNLATLRGCEAILRVSRSAADIDKALERYLTV